MKREEVDAIQEIGALESKLDIAEAERKTVWFGDYAMYEKRDLQEKIDYTGYIKELKELEDRKQNQKKVKSR